MNKEQRKKLELEWIKNKNKNREHNLSLLGNAWRFLNKSGILNIIKKK